MKELGRAVRARQGFWAEEDGPTVTEYALLCGFNCLLVYLQR